MTDAMPPLALSVMRTIIPFREHVAGQIESKRIQTAGGRLYADITPILRHPLGRRMLLRGFKNMDRLAVIALAELAERPRFLSNGERFNHLKLLPAALPHILRMFHILFWAKSEGVTSEVLSFINSYIAAMKTKLNVAPDVRSKLDIAMSEMQQIIKPILTWAPYSAAGIAATALLNTLLISKDDTNDSAALERGLTGHVATEMNLAVGGLADAARASKVLMAHLSRVDLDAKTRLAGAANLPGGEAFVQAWDTFMISYGARAPSEIDLSRPRWSEDPSSLLQMVVNVMGHSEPGAHRAHYQKLIEEGEKATQNLVVKAQKSWWGWVRAPFICRLISLSRNLSPLREHHKFLCVRLLALIKPVLLEAGKQLEEEDKLKSS
ncbi:MAG: hypothetical protein AAF266_02005, partial [Planctomycetota bacterium]